MSSSISWFQFLVFPLAADALYYIYVGFTYYRKDWLYRLRNRKRWAVPTDPAAPAATPGSTPSQEKDPFLQVHDLVDEIRALLQGVGEGAEKDMLLEKQCLLLKKYPTLHSSPFQPSINQLIAAECKTHCDVELEEHDLDSLWLS